MRLLLAFSMVSLMASCGSEREIEPKAGGAPVAAQPPVAGDDDDDGDAGDSFADIQPLVTAYCSRCHSSDAFITSGSAWQASNAAARLANSSMPPPSTQEARNLSSSDRQRLINF